MKVSIIIPVHNGEKTIKNCLKSIYESSYNDFEVIVVDDASTDSTPQIAKTFPCKVINLKENKGPATARNLGAKNAEGEILLFIDADVVIKNNTLEKIITNFKTLTEISAVQGVYAHQAYLPNLPTLYKQYHHHLKFKKASKFLNSTSTFCLAVKKKEFKSIGGFDEGFSPTSAAEDVELGLRLNNAGCKIYLNKKIKVTHLKKHSLKSLLTANFRVVSSNIKLMLRQENTKNFPISKNKRHKMTNTLISIILAPLLIILLFTFFSAPWLCLPLISGYLINFTALNHGLISTIRQEQGLLKAVGCWPVLYLDMLVSFVAVVYAGIDYSIFNNKY